VWRTKLVSPTYPAVAFAIAPTFFAQLLLVHASRPQLAALLIGAVTIIAVTVRIDPEASWPKLDAL
jgi:hypothetical protein